MSRTYGTAKLVRGEWHVQAEPHVMLRLRRMFRRTGGSVGTVKLTASDEVAKDLLWFTQRYPLEVTPCAALERGASSFDERAEAFSALLAGTIEPRAFDLAIPARRYQQVAADLAFRSGGLLIADDVGLGKTASAIAMLTDPTTRPALVVTLTHLPRQWARELGRFAPKLRVHIAKKATPYDLTPKQKRAADQLELIAPEFPDVVILNYHKLAGWSEALAGKVRTVVFDEVQELRHWGSQRYDAAKHVADACHFRVGLSATPIYNYGSEFHSVMEAVRPGALGTRAEFLGEWCSSNADPRKAAIKDAKAFGTYVREAGLMLRRTRADVGRELPHLSKSVVHVDSDEKALDAISKDVAELARIILETGGVWKEKGQAARDLDWRLRQATGIAKAPYVAEFVRLLVESGEKVVLYGWHREVYSIWLDRLADLKPVLYTGTESPLAKERSVEAFTRGEAKVLAISLRAGAGLDGLQGHARTIVFGELDWSPGVHEQAIGRVHRDGQGDPVVAYFLVADDGSDPVVMDVLGLKREQIEGIRDPNAALLESTKTDALRTLAESFLRQRGLEVPGAGRDGGVSADEAPSPSSSCSAPSPARPSAAPAGSNAREALPGEDSRHRDVTGPADLAGFRGG